MFLELKIFFAGFVCFFAPWIRRSAFLWRSGSS